MFKSLLFRLLVLFFALPMFGLRALLASVSKLCIISCLCGRAHGIVVVVVVVFPLLWWGCHVFIKYRLAPPLRVLPAGLSGPLHAASMVQRARLEIAIFGIFGFGRAHRTMKHASGPPAVLTTFFCTRGDCGCFEGLAETVVLVFDFR